MEVTFDGIPETVIPLQSNDTEILFSSIGSSNLQQELIEAAGVENIYAD